jgi:hypothetical protein
LLIFFECLRKKKKKEEEEEKMGQTVNKTGCFVPEAASSEC